MTDSKDLLIKELEDTLSVATDTIDDNAAEIRRLKETIQGLEMQIAHSSAHSNGKQTSLSRSSDTFDDKDVPHGATINRQMSGKHHDLPRPAPHPNHKKMSDITASIVEGNEEEDEPEEAGLVKDLQDRLHIVEFESTHLKEKYEKVLHTVDMLNDEISVLKADISNKNKMISELKALAGQHDAPVARSMSYTDVPEPAAELKLSDPNDKTKRLWGPAAAKGASAKAPVTPSPGGKVSPVSGIGRTSPTSGPSGGNGGTSGLSGGNGGTSTKTPRTPSGGTTPMTGESSVRARALSGYGTPGGTTPTTSEHSARARALSRKQQAAPTKTTPKKKIIL